MTLLPMNAGRVSARELRRKLNQDTKLTQEQIIPAVNQLLHNEKVTQKKLANLEAFAQMSFVQRVRWIFRGVS